jgi:2-polyprenyl-3-methyl-5-hydroxy-6-metoxy-1,4-benzoquinol methylase
VESRTPAQERIDRVLLDLVQPSDYVKWEYFSRQRLLARGIVGSRQAQPTRVLDIGCGHGALSLTLAESAGFDVVAMDVLESRVRSVEARKATRDPRAAARVRIVRADAESLPFRDESFDAVAATEVLEHLDEPGRMLSEAHRVLRPAGRFFMTTPNSDALPYRILRFLPDSAVSRLAASLTQETLHPELLHDHAAAAGTSGHPDRHRREGFTLRELGHLGAEAGLRMAVAHTYRIPIPDRVMQVTPRALSRSLATLGTHPLPLGLQLYAEFMKT